MDVLLPTAMYYKKCLSLCFGLEKVTTHMLDAVTAARKQLDVTLRGSVSTTELPKLLLVFISDLVYSSIIAEKGVCSLWVHPDCGDGTGVAVDWPTPVTLLDSSGMSECHA